MSDTIELRGPERTEAAGAALAAALAGRRGAVIYLEGDLGAGKTTLARGFLRALGVSGTVRSPTYTLMEPYAVEGRSVLHMDLYRLGDPSELWELGLDSYPIEQTLWLVEWPERGGTLLPPPTLRLHLAHRGDRRVLSCTGDDALLSRLRAGLQR